MRGGPEITGFKVDLALHTFDIAWTAKAGKNYAVESSVNLRDWFQIAHSGIVPKESATITGSLSSDGLTHYYRIREL